MDNKQKRQRIGFVIGEMGRGGAERVISILANDYAKKGWTVDILMLLDNRCEYELHENVELKPICDKSKSGIRQFPFWLHEIRSYVKDNQPDRIVSFIARINIITLFSCLGLKQNIIVSERNDPAADGRSILVKLATYLLYPMADHVVFQTRWAQSCFPTTIHNKSVIIPNPISVTVQASPEKKRKIVSVGRLDEQKNHEMLIRAFKRVHDFYPEYSLYIYGEGILREKLMAQIEQSHLSSAVFLPGSIANIHEEMADATMFVLSSNYEGLSNALLEAMMMGLPCISTNCAGSNEIIDNGKNGMIIPIKGEDALVETMCSLITNSDLARKIALGAEDKSLEYRTTSVVEKWQALI